MKFFLILVALSIWTYADTILSQANSAYQSGQYLKAKNILKEAGHRGNVLA